MTIIIIICAFRLYFNSRRPACSYVICYLIYITFHTVSLIGTFLYENLVVTYLYVISFDVTANL
jgi:hypothetical protein